jgi:hypothetical protein
MAAHDAILEHRVDQTFHANRKHRKSKIYAVDDRVYLSTQNLTLPKGRARKLVPRYIAYALEQAELARTMVMPTPQCVELPLCPKYPREGEPLPHRDPPIPMTGHLPCSLGRSVLRTADWVDECPLEDIHFKELHELTKLTPPTERT